MTYVKHENRISHGEKKTRVLPILGIITAKLSISKTEKMTCKGSPTKEMKGSTTRSYVSRFQPKRFFFYYSQTAHIYIYTRTLRKSHDGDPDDNTVKEIWGWKKKLSLTEIAMTLNAASEIFDLYFP